MTQKEIIKDFILSGLKSPKQELGGIEAGELKFTVEPNVDLELGDYKTNIAFQVAARARKNPAELAELIARAFLQAPKAHDFFDKIEAKNGFVNFTFTKSFLHASLYQLLRDKKVAIPEAPQKSKINIEFISANPTGALHVGNGRGAFYGDVLGNVLKKVGHKVTKEYYVNNAKVSLQIRELGRTFFGWGEKYKTPYLEKKMDELKDDMKRGNVEQEELTNITDEGDAGYLLARGVLADTRRFLEEKAKILFDVWTEEEELYRKKYPEETFDFLARKGLVYKKEGAEWLRTTEFKDDKDKVLRRSDGTFGYYLADIAYHRNKISRKFDVIVDILGADHHGHVKPLEVAMKILGFKGKFVVFIAQLVRAKGGGRLSKRAGEVVDLEELIDEVGIDAARFFYLSRSLSSQMEFDIDLAKEQSQKNPIFYVQYAHARTSGILANAASSAAGGTGKNQKGATKEDLAFLTSTEELGVVRKILQYPDIILAVAESYETHLLPVYVYELAALFSKFYETSQVLAEDMHVRNARLALTSAFRLIIEDALLTMGISAPERM